MFERHFASWPQGLPHHLALPQTSIYTNLEISALRYPDRAAIVYYDSPISYAELKREVDALAGHLQQLGVAKGDRVLVFMQNSPQFIIAYYAIVRANAVVVPVNPMNKAAELQHYLHDTQASVCVSGQEVLPSIAPLLGTAALEHVIVAAYNAYVTQETDLELPTAVADPVRPLAGEGMVSWADAVTAGHAPGPLEVGPDDLAVLPYSSGTTGAPKGCMHTHRSVMASCVQGVAWMGVTSEARTLATLPYFHVTAMQGSMNSCIFSGSTIVLMTRWNRQTAARLIQRYQITGWTNIVTMVIDLLADPDIERYDLSSLNTIGGGGAAMPGAVSERLFELTGLRYCEGYGLSETMAGTHINPPGAPKPQCGGIPVFDVDCRVIDLNTHAELGVGEIGEIVSRGPQVFVGYWNRPEETERAFIDIGGEKFFRTGDMGYYDEQGYFFIVDRLKRMINASGYKVWPAEVEGLVFRHPAIRECCIVSAPDARRGETVKACVVLNAGDTGRVGADDIIAWCRGNMAAYKVPGVVELCESLPRSPTGKVMWRALQEQEWKTA